MPNLPCVVQAGAMVFARGEGASDEDAALLQNLLNSCGLCEEVPESYINTHTGLSGSGVAYVSAAHPKSARRCRRPPKSAQRPRFSYLWGPFFFFFSPLLCFPFPRSTSLPKPWPRGP